MMRNDHFTYRYACSLLIELFIYTSVQLRVYLNCFYEYLRSKLQELINAYVECVYTKLKIILIFFSIFFIF